MQQNVFHQPNKDALNRILLTEYFRCIPYSSIMPTNL